MVAGISIEAGEEEKLRALGVKDSKQLLPRQRESLAKGIEALAKDVVVLSLSACKIDSLRNGGVNLNRIEAEKFADILSLLNPGLAYIDSPDVNPERLSLQLRKMIGPRELVVEHKADQRYPVVSAASIIAKVERDREVRELHKKYGDFGPGYSSNEKTIAWLRAWLEKNREWPDIVRKTWETAREIRREKSQKGIRGFLGRLREKEECGPQGSRTGSSGPLAEGRRDAGDSP